jgi:catechol 2,3-dioxygenase-like lactoylglutathione lyase family enzyme
MGPETARHEPHALISGIHHLKTPVTDLNASLSWWRDVTGARHDETLDHRTPDGRLFACVVQIPGAGPYLELRLDPAGASAVAGLDPVTFAVDTRSGLARLDESLESLAIPHSPVLRGIAGWLLVTLTPDGLAVRFHTRETHEWDPEHADFGSPWLSPPRG